MARLICLCFVSLTVKRYSVRLYFLFRPGNISIKKCFLFITLFFPAFSNTLTKELLTYCICVYIKEKEMGFAFVNVSILHFVSPAWLSVIKGRMWLNFPRLGFASTVVYTVQKSFYTSKFFLFLIFYFFSFMENDPFSGPEVLPLMFQMPFSFIYLSMKFVSMKQKVIFHTQCVLSLNRTLPGVSFLWGLMFDCIMHTQIRSFSLPIKYCWQGKESPQAVLFFSSLSLSFPFSSPSLFIPQCNREERGVEIF